MKKLLFALLVSTRAVHLISWLNRKRVSIICYHSVTSDAAPVERDPHKQHIPLRLFLRHLDYLQANYNPVSLSEYLQASRNKLKLPDYSVVLTFDDGFEDFYSVVAPHLFQRELPATVFIITDRAFGRFVPKGESFLNWEQIRELSASGIEIGSHSCSHLPLSELSLEEVTRELGESQALLESNVGCSPVPLSYPFGRTSESVSRLAHSLGYTCAIASDSGPNSEKASVYRLSRTVIASDDDVATFAARVSGLTSWINRCKRFVVQDRQFQGGLPSVSTAQPLQSSTSTN
jgi:peptidoglycan/xylan/chitin deacetylase (PgdA/CDA1 family)